jgi:hypothetical protein
MSSPNTTLLPDDGEQTFLCDARIKLDVTEVPSYVSLDAVNRLQVNRFRLRNNARRTGLVAQQVKQAMPDAVRISKRTVNGTSYDDFHSISSTTLVSHLVGAVRALTQQVQMQQRQLQNLEVTVFQPVRMPFYARGPAFATAGVQHPFNPPAPFVADDEESQDETEIASNTADDDGFGSDVADVVSELLADQGAVHGTHIVCECASDDDIDCECFKDGVVRAWADADDGVDDEIEEECV